MEGSPIQLDNLPNEILMAIFSKLHNTDVLYSLIGVNKRLDTIVKDSMFTEDIILVTHLDGLHELTDKMIDRFCFKILPQIHQKIYWLHIDSLYMEHILLAAKYPVLCGLGLCNLSSKMARNFFTDENSPIYKFQYQVRLLVIHINKCEEPSNSIKHINKFIYTRIFTIFKNLHYLNFNPNGSYYHQLTFNLSPPNISCSTLKKLNIMVNSYEDCLYLLDGRFHQLQMFSVTICSPKVPLFSLINNKKKLPNLKCFMLTHKSVVLVYNTFLIPLLRRMSNLEELDLYFVNHNTSIIDGNNLEMNIINYMKKLKKFTFNIRSVIPFNNQVNLPSNDDIQNTFKNFNNTQIISFIDYFPKSNEYHYHIYSYPHIWLYYHNISNNFPDGLFKYVRRISLFDERPFEHEFFLRLTQSFPFIKELILHNRQPQKNNNQQLPIIIYSHLTELDLIETHENYVEQFLNDVKMCLLNNIHLHVDYNILQKATHNFTSDATRINCSKIKFLTLYNESNLSLDLKEYFCHAKICGL